MMKNAAGLVIGFVMISSSAWAWTEAETNDVVCTLIGVAHAQEESDASIDSDNIILPPVPEVESFDDLFVTDRQTDLAFWSQWTPEERKAAFDNFLMSIPSGESSRYGASELVALDFCISKDYTNVLDVAQAILQSTNVTADCKISASVAFAKFAAPTEERNRFAESFLTNRVVFANKYARSRWMHSRERWVMPSIFIEMSHALSRDCDAGRTALARSGAAMLYRNLDEPICARYLDDLLMKTHSGYGTSSNRLAIACMALDSQQTGEFDEAHFIGITNQLLNAEQPLPVVEGL